MRVLTRSLKSIIILSVLTALLAGVALGAEIGIKTRGEAELIGILKSDASWADKNLACRELQVVGTKKCIPAVAALLPDPELSHLARIVLEPMNYPEAARAMREALSKTSGLVKVGIINSLGYIEDKEAAVALIALLQDSDVAVSNAAVSALGRIGTKESMRPLNDFYGAVSESRKGVVIEALLTGAERLLRAGQRGQGDATEIYTSLQKPSFPEHIRLGAFAGLLRADPKNAAAHVLKAIGGQDTLLRSTAIANIATLKDPNLAKRLADELPNLPADVQVSLVGALADRGDAAALPAIRKTATEARNAELRLAALKALGALGDASCVELLCQTIAEPKSDTERQMALGSLEILKGDGVDFALLAAMKRAPSEARANLIAVLVARETPGAAEALLGEAKGGDSRVSGAALRALGQISGPEVLPALLNHLVNLKGDASRSEAEKAVVQISRKIKDESAQADPTIEALKKSRQVPAECSLYRVLGAIANDKALFAVTFNGMKGAPEIRDVAIRALAAWPNTSALGPLQAEFGKSEDPVHRALLLRGCVRLLRQGEISNSRTLTAYRDLMKSATQPSDRKLVLGGLAEVNDPGALKIVEPCLTDPKVSAEAELAVLGIAQSIFPSSPDLAKSAAAKLSKDSKNEEIRAEAERIMRRIERNKDFITSWTISGPYSQRGRKGAQLFRQVFAPENSEPSAEWKPLQNNALGAKPGMIDLEKAIGGENCVAYARTWVFSEKPQSALLEMGVDDGIRVWLNGKVVHQNNSEGAAIAGEEKAKIQLKKGWNLLLLKIIQGTSAWEFCAAIRTREGNSIKGLRVNADYEPQAPKAPKDPKSLTVERVKVKKPRTQAAWGWKPLFNGKDLTGWTQTGDAIFKVENGNLVGTQTTGKGGDLWTVKEYDDFEMRVTYRVDWPANTGFWFRHNGKKGYQYDVLKYEKPVAFSGSLYCPGKLFITKNLDESIENRDDWNEALLRAEGDKITLWLNGKQTGECSDDTLQKGKIGIQIHPGDQFKGMKVTIKRFEVRRLSAK